MTLTTNEVAELKAQLYSQIESLPEDKKVIAKKQIEEMSADTLEYMLKEQSKPSKEKEKGVFRLIIDRDIESLEIGENKKALAVLDINPISKGHTLIIPKSPVRDSKNLPNSAFVLAKSLSKKIIKELKAKSTEIHTENKLGECIIHVIPVFETPVHLGSPRQKSTKEELENIASKIRIKKRQRIPKVKKPSVAIQSQPIKRRIP
ncbi:MAG: HIT family protein [Nanoarchaeota archaeon]